MPFTWLITYKTPWQWLPCPILHDLLTPLWAKLQDHVSLTTKLGEKITPHCCYQINTGEDGICMWNWKRQPSTVGSNSGGSRPPQHALTAPTFRLPLAAVCAAHTMRPCHISHERGHFYSWKNKVRTSYWKYSQVPVQRTWARRVLNYKPSVLIIYDVVSPISFDTTQHLYGNTVTSNVSWEGQSCLWSVQTEEARLVGELLNQPRSSPTGRMSPSEFTFSVPSQHVNEMILQTAHLGPYTDWQWSRNPRPACASWQNSSS